MRVELDQTALFAPGVPHRFADAPPCLLTAKILRVIRAAAARVVRRRRIGTQWTRAIDDAGGQMCGFD